MIQNSSVKVCDSFITSKHPMRDVTERRFTVITTGDNPIKAFVLKMTNQSRSKFYERNLVLNKSKLVLNLFSLLHLNLDLTTILLQSELR